MAPAVAMPDGCVHGRDEAEAAARAIGRPVASRCNRADIPHKTEAGAVVLDVCPDAARRRL